MRPPSGTPARVLAQNTQNKAPLSLKIQLLADRYPRTKPRHADKITTVHGGEELSFGAGRFLNGLTRYFDEDLEVACGLTTVDRATLDQLPWFSVWRKALSMRRRIDKCMREQESGSTPSMACTLLEGQVEALLNNDLFNPEVVGPVELLDDNDAVWKVDVVQLARRVSANFSYAGLPCDHPYLVNKQLCARIAAEAPWVADAQQKARYNGIVPLNNDRLLNKPAIVELIMHHHPISEPQWTDAIWISAPGADATFALYPMPWLETAAGNWAACAGRLSVHLEPPERRALGRLPWFKGWLRRVLERLSDVAPYMRRR